MNGFDWAGSASPTPFHLLPVALLLACAGSGTETKETPDTTPDADTDTDTDADTDSDADTDADTDTDTDADTDTTSTADTSVTTGGRDGTYVGDLHVDVQDIGFVVNYGSCDIPGFTVVVDTTTVPSITGAGQCATSGVLAGQTFTISLAGDIPADPAIGGTATVTWPAVPMVLNSPLTGTFTDAITLEGATSGVWGKGSQGFEWQVTFTVQK